MGRPTEIEGSCLGQQEYKLVKTLIFQIVLYGVVNQDNGKDRDVEDVLC